MQSGGPSSFCLSPIMLLLQGRKPMFARLEAPDQGWHVNEGKVELTFSPAKCRGWNTLSPSRMLREPYWLSRWRAAVEAWMPLKRWFKDLIKTPEISKEPSGKDFSLENVQSGQCPILAARNLPSCFLTWLNRSSRIPSRTSRVSQPRSVAQVKEQGTWCTKLFIIN